MPPASTIAAIIPAAGRSTRMGTAKQLIEIDGRPMLLGVVDAIRRGGVARVIVVTHRAVADALATTRGAGDVHFVLNDDPATTMIDSIRLGLAHALDAAGVLVCPGDAARLSADDVRRCLDAFASDPDRLVVAARDGKRGHPTIVPASLFAAIRSPACDAGLNHLARRHPERVLEVPCASPGVTSNINTPADLSAMD
jgi:molybdenum cofactor cytidylyltransferase